MPFLLLVGHGWRLSAITNVMGVFDVFTLTTIMREVSCGQEFPLILSVLPQLLFSPSPNSPSNVIMLKAVSILP